jgi:UDPglucose--hexose-1-phosphate uridylyltransferase
MELRKDYILDRYVIISSGRGKRPFEFKKECSENNDDPSKCFFCPGHEDQTPPEIGRIPSGDNWQLRWFPNKFAVVTKEGDPSIRTDNKFFTFASGYGFHEVIVETNDHSKQLADLEIEQIKMLLGIYIERINNLSKKENIEYVSIFKNHGREAGTSLVHSHSQIIAYNKLPNLIKDKVQAVKNYSSCPYCEIINIEKDSDRRCFENNNFVAFSPYASRFHFEIWIFPKDHIKNITDMTDPQIWELAEILKKALSRLKELNISYNMALFYSPHGEDLHFHIEITPRQAIWAGFELLTEDIINSMSPEDSARFYRGENE